MKPGENPKIPYPQCGRRIKTYSQTIMMPPLVSQSMGLQYGHTPKQLHCTCTARHCAKCAPRDCTIMTECEIKDETLALCRQDVLFPMCLRKGVCPAHYFCINYPSFKPGFTLPHRSPPSRPEWTANPPYKARRISQNS